ncbi:allophanate hydrolase [Amycolatopsis acidicola]|uniref:Allophanate hydrolase n=1 Tax=Amycolatopsis acidicola TaxID=2596893 RepID=A0A5N0VD43_9PSEU|nr:allophanate hydrolase [Amycolatopsis acidicola]KAA9162572.1 allophanate hydrolase [Amycolatopsis acidicola]
MTGTTDRVREAFRLLRETGRPEAWITLRDEQDLLLEAKLVDERTATGEHLPLAGTVFAVKDNIDVAGLPTTAGCPSYAYSPERNATAVARLLDAGALCLGKTNLDQFATGLVGTRSPYGAVRHAFQPDKISGGSSSGSAVAVALGIADFALGTDTAGSGRVPAALHGIFGLKPTLGLIPTTGVVPAARSYDCVTVFGRSLATAQRALRVMTGPDPADPGSRTWPATTRYAAANPARVAVPDAAGLVHLTPEARKAFATTIERLRGTGAEITPVDTAPLLEAAGLLYEGALVAERHAAVGAFLESGPADADPVVADIIRSAGRLPAHALATDLDRLARHRATATALLSPFDALLMPTTTRHPTLAEVAADPVEVNSRLGVYTNFVNLLDLAAVAVPAGAADGSPFGVSIITRAFDDQTALDLAAALTGESIVDVYPDGGTDLAVFGAHLRGRPLNHQLTDLGARYAGTVRTAPEYRMAALPTEPPKPGIVRDTTHGASLTGERWTLSPAALGTFLARLPAPLSLGPIRLDDGSQVTGFHCDPVAAAEGTDITRYGSWTAYLERRT